MFYRKIYANFTSNNLAINSILCRLLHNLHKIAVMHIARCGHFSLALAVRANLISKYPRNCDRIANLDYSFSSLVFAYAFYVISIPVNL